MLEELKNQYEATAEMLDLAVKHCPQEFWGRVFGDNSPFWKEAYHCIFWLHNFLGGPAKTFDPKPFGLDIDPRLFQPCVATCSQAQLMECIAATRTHIAEVFADLTPSDLEKDDQFGDGFRSVPHRLLYGLRHGQHHTGKLTGYLFSNGVDYDPWRG